MKRIILFMTMAAFMSCTSCSEDDSVKPREPQSDRPRALIDAQATPATAALYQNLFNITEKGTMFGAQIPTLYGLDEPYVEETGSTNDRWFAKDSDTEYYSDTKFIAGSHPAVCGWELSGLELDNELNIDKEDFNDIRKHIIAAYDRGAVNTISWHCANPVSGGNSWDGTRAVYSIIPGGANHEKFKGWLDKIADFMLSLKGSDGELIPLIFRPWHEHTGAGFWWGKGNCSQSEFVALWQFTVEYLRDEKGLHNLIWAYSPDMIHLSSRDDYLEYWPGDDWVDVLGLDAYDRASVDYGHRGLQLVRMSQVIAAEKNKPFAITETGLENNDPQYSPDYYNEKWWTQMLYKMIDGQPVSFALVWRNGDLPTNGGHFFNAFRGCYTEADFREFASKPNVLLENDLPDMYR